MTSCPAGLPLAASVKGQETAASGLEGDLLGLEWVGEVRDPVWTKVGSGRVPPTVEHSESGGQIGG